MDNFDINQTPKTTKITADFGQFFKPQVSSKNRKNKEELAQLAEILGLPELRKCSIRGREGPLRLVHYDLDYEFDYPSVRGLVCDLDNKVMVCSSLGYIETIVCDEVKRAQQKIMLKSPKGWTRPPFQRYFDESRVKFYPGFEGTSIRIFKYGGKVYYSNHRSLDASKSWWGESLTFQELFEKLSGPQKEELFNQDKDYSQFCHYFTIVHPDLLLATSLHVGNGFLVYMGSERVYHGNPFEGVDDQQIDNQNYFQDHYDRFVYDFEAVSRGYHTDSFVYHLANFPSLQEVNNHLKEGFASAGWSTVPGNSTDPVTRKGKLPPGFNIFQPSEYTLMMVYDQDQKISQCYRIQSTEYTRRLNARNNQNDVYWQFCRLVDELNLKDGMKVTFNRLVALRIKNHLKSTDVLEEAKKEYYDKGSIDFSQWIEPKPFYLQLKRSAYKNQQQRFDLIVQIWINFYLSLPPTSHKDAINLIDQYYADRDDLTHWLYDQFIHQNNPFDAHVSDFYKIYQDVHQFTNRMLSWSHNKGKSYKDLFYQNLRTTIYRQKTYRFFSLIKNLCDYTRQNKIHENTEPEELLTSSGSDSPSPTDN